MTKSINTVLISGEVPIEMFVSETKHFGKFVLVVSEIGADGREFTSRITCLMFEKVFDLFANVVKKGSFLMVAGRINSSKYQKKDTIVYETNVIVDRLTEIVRPEVSKYLKDGSEMTRKPIS